MRQFLNSEDRFVALSKFEIIERFGTMMVSLYLLTPFIIDSPELVSIRRQINAIRKDLCSYIVALESSIFVYDKLKQ